MTITWKGFMDEMLPTLSYWEGIGMTWILDDKILKKLLDSSTSQKNFNGRFWQCGYKKIGKVFLKL
jgi:hypothetical protein